MLSWLMVAVAIVLVKLHYSSATADELWWILAPTARLVELLTGANFQYEAGAGWMNREALFVIAPACAGINFLLAAFLSLALVSLPRVRRIGNRFVVLAAALLLAYGAALLLNAVRIAVAMGERAAAGQHRAEGVAVFFLGLCVLHLCAKRALRALESRGFARGPGYVG